MTWSRCAQLAAQGAMIERARHRTAGAASRRRIPRLSRAKRRDGRGHIAERSRRGAAAVLWESEDFAWRREWRVPNVGVRDLQGARRAALPTSSTAALDALWVCGVTGTNGKTSCSQWIAAALGAARHARRRDRHARARASRAPLIRSSNTTPDALELHACSRNSCAEGASARRHGSVVARPGAGPRRTASSSTRAVHQPVPRPPRLSRHDGSLRRRRRRSCSRRRVSQRRGAQPRRRGRACARAATGRQRRARDRLQCLGRRAAAASTSRATSRCADGEMDDRIALGPRHGEECNSSAASTWRTCSACSGCLIANGIAVRRCGDDAFGLPAVPGRMQQVGDEAAGRRRLRAHARRAREGAAGAAPGRGAARRQARGACSAAAATAMPASGPLMGAVASRLADRVGGHQRQSAQRRSPEDHRRRYAPGMLRRLRAWSPTGARAIAAAIAGAARADVVLIAGKGHESYQEIAGRRACRSRDAAWRATRCAGRARMMSLAEAARGRWARSVRGGDVRFSGVSTDSRTLRSGRTVRRAARRALRRPRLPANAAAAEARRGAGRSQVRGRSAAAAAVVDDTRARARRARAHWRARFRSGARSR